MAFLSPTFVNDIFLSYAHADNLRTPGASAGWVDLFKATLEVELSRLIGEVGVIHIWMDDRGLDSNHAFDDEIKEQIRRSGLFLALTSRGYLRKDGYCLKELALFHEKAQKSPEALKVGTRSRIFNGRLSNFSNFKDANWPHEFAGTIGATLYETIVTESGDPSSVGGKTFETQVKGLANAIYSTLSEYRDALECTAPLPPPLPEPAAEEAAPAIFLADTVEGLSELRESVLARLKDEGITVAKRMPPPYPPGHDAEARKAMEDATLSVHLLDVKPGEKFIDASGKTFLQRQAEIGLEHAKSQYVWLPPSPLVDIPSVKPEDYREFLKGLEAHEYSDKDRYAFARVSDNGVPDEIVKRFRHLTAPKQPGDSAAALLETHRKDQLHAVALYQLLAGAAYTTYINPEGDDPGKNVGRLQELAREVSVFVIVFGEVTPDWVVERLNSCLQAASAVDPPRLRLCGIYSPQGAEEAARRNSLRIPPVEIPIIYSTKPDQLVSKIAQYAGGGK